MQLLLVEDEDPKRAHIQSFVSALVPSAKILTARSVQSALDALDKGKIDLVLLDMSLPTFDVGESERGGRPQGFGGVEVLRYMDRCKLNIPTIVVTAYEAFFLDDKKTGVNLECLGDELMQDHPKTFRGLVYYNSIVSGWDAALAEKILAVQRELDDEDINR